MNKIKVNSFGFEAIYFCEDKFNKDEQTHLH